MFRGKHIVLLFILWGMVHPCAFSGELPKRLVLALDGISYQKVEKAIVQGLFKSFFHPSKMIAPFPSMSDPSWSDIFKTARPVGVQRLYFNPVLNKIQGHPFSDLKTRREFERRVNAGDEGPIHHAKTYVMAFRLARNELNNIKDKFFLSENEKESGRGGDVFFAYTGSSDSLLHTTDVSAEYLAYLDQVLNEIQDLYRKKTGHELKIDLFSDHGNNGINGKSLPIDSHLSKFGFKSRERIKSSMDIVIPRAGIVNYIQIFCHGDKKREVAGASLLLEGVDLALIREENKRVRVLAKRDGKREEALIESSPELGNEWIRYRVISGDPLKLIPILDELKKAHKVSSLGFVSRKDWFRSTRNHLYPYGAVRVWRSFYENIIFPPPVFLSLKDGWTGINPFLDHFTNTEKMEGGTHGNLLAPATMGVILSNYHQTQDLPSHRLKEELIQAEESAYPLGKHWMHLDGDLLTLSLPKFKGRKKAFFYILLEKNLASGKETRLQTELPILTKDHLVRISLKKYWKKLPVNRGLEIGIEVASQNDEGEVLERRKLKTLKIFYDGTRGTLIGR